MKSVLGGFIEITWTLTTVAQRDAVSNTRLHLVTVPSRQLLYSGLVLPKSDFAKASFDGYIENCNINLH